MPDTRRHVPKEPASRGLDLPMPAVKGRKRRPDGIAREVVELKVRVRAEHRAMAFGVADTLGISAAAYIDALLAREELDARGRPVWWTEPVPGDQEALPVQG